MGTATLTLTWVFLPRCKDARSWTLSSKVHNLHILCKYEDRKSRDQGGDVDGEQGRKDKEKMKGEGVGGDG